METYRKVTFNKSLQRSADWLVEYQDRSSYQLSFSSKTKKSSANSSTSFFIPSVLEAVCDPTLEFCCSSSHALQSSTHGWRSTHLAQLRRQITNGPIRPLNRSWRASETMLAHACVCLLDALLWPCDHRASLLYLGHIDRGVVRRHRTLLLLCSWSCILCNIPVVRMCLTWETVYYEFILWWWWWLLLCRLIDVYSV